MTPRIPTLQEFLAYKGAHTHRLWEQGGPHWTCPSCKRTKFQILRWTTRNPNSQHAFKDWIAPLHKHHDHSSGLISCTESRFPEIIICDQCNAADGAAKRKLKLPKLFSFSPSEISVFVSAIPHGKHTIDYNMANAIFQAINFSSPLAYKWQHLDS